MDEAARLPVGSQAAFLFLCWGCSIVFITAFQPMSFLSRDATIAKPGFNRWLVPPAAIAVHMCIGQVYGFSVFKKPLGARFRRHRSWGR